MELICSNALRDKVCLITGTSRGIGRQVVKSFASQGAIVYANARVQGQIDAFSAELSEKYQTKVIPVYFDVTDTPTAKKAFLQINKECSKLDVLVNNAGIMQDALIGMIMPDMLQDLFAVNVFAPIEMMQLAVKLMARRQTGSIINISSVVGAYGNPGQVAYSATKGAVIALTKSAAKELAPQHIRVNAIAPGMIDTDMLRSVGEEKRQQLAACIMTGRLGTPEDVANACIFLASDLSDYVTGQVLGVDGGAVL